MPSLLSRYLIRGNTFLILPTLAVGIGMYILTDLFERLDSFIEAELAIGVVVTYFVVKTPLVVAQILPVIFLLSTTIQLCLMARNRELVALQAGGISLVNLAGILLLCGCLWGGIQLAFSEVLGIKGEQASARIWQEDVRKRNLAQSVLRNLWFTENIWVVSLDSLSPNGSGTGFSAYKLSNDNLGVELILKAESFTAKANDWQLINVLSYDPAGFSVEKQATMALPLTQDPQAFRFIYGSQKLDQLPLWELSQTIERLSASGSNVEGLRTSWHMKWAYAASLAVLALCATALVSVTTNIYIATVLALGGTFIYFAVYTLGSAMAQQGTLPPFVGAWLANALALVLALLRLIPLFLRRSSF